MGDDFFQPAVPTIDRDTCADCGACAKICPSQSLVWRDGKVEITGGTFLGCIGCGHCMMVCPSRSVHVAGRRITPGDLVNLPAKSEWATPEQLDGLLLARRSIRRFSDEEVDRATVERILAMTSTAPMGIPPSQVGIVVFQGRPKVRALVADMIASLRRMRTKLVWTLRLGRFFMSKAGYASLRGFVLPLVDLLAERWDQGQDVLFYDAPLVLLFHHGPMADPADAQIAATYAMLAAESLGLGSCMIGSAMAITYDKPLMAKCGIPAENKVTLALIVGRPAAAPFRRGIRRQLASVKWAE
jgi:nitroreductase/Pyruvate/2-oxoacid:ferredoxin oxidoreductase delta subunit